MSYRYLGNNQYEITLKLYQDCLTGLPDAISQDIPIFLGVYKNGQQYSLDSVGGATVKMIEGNFTGCDFKPPFCMREATIVKIYTLPPTAAGYQIVYQRCCRGHITNIDKADTHGVTLYCDIPTNSLAGNSSAVFNHSVPQIVCPGNSIEMDFSATDVDGDSLSYEFCPVYQGGSNANPKPLPAPGPFTPLSFSTPYSFDKPLASTSALNINPESGLVSGNPDSKGIFLFAVACNEWRNGVKINSVRKEFEVLVGTNETEFSIGPNPVSYFLSVNLLNLKGKATVRIFNAAGALVITKELHSPGGLIDVYELPKSVYLLTYKDATRTQVMKLVKN